MVNEPIVFEPLKFYCTCNRKGKTWLLCFNNIGTDGSPHTVRKSNQAGTWRQNDVQMTSKRRRVDVDEMSNCRQCVCREVMGHWMQSKQCRHRSDLEGTTFWRRCDVITSLRRQCDIIKTSCVCCKFKNVLLTSWLLVLNYSRLSLSRLRLSQITAYLEEKTWSLFKHRNLTSGNKILWIRGEIAPEEQFLPFPTIF